MVMGEDGSVFEVVSKMTDFNAHFTYRLSAQTEFTAI